MAKKRILLLRGYGRFPKGSVQTVRGPIAELLIKRGFAEDVVDEAEQLKSEADVSAGGADVEADSEETDAVETFLPDDFPAMELLAEAGFDSLDAVRAASDDELLAVSGIGKATLEKIREAQE